MMCRLPKNSFSTSVFHSCPQVKLPEVHIITPSLSSTQIWFLLCRKGGGNYVNLQILVKFTPLGLILDQALFDFAAFLNYKNFNTVLCLEGFYHSQFALYLLTYTLLIHTIYMSYLPKICAAHIYFAVLNGRQISYEMQLT